MIEENTSILRDPIFIAMCIVITLAAILVSYMELVSVPENDKKNAEEKTKLDSFSCPQLGKWIIDNSRLQDINYPYAQAKYLVCTHGGISP